MLKEKLHAAANDVEMLKLEVNNMEHTPEEIA